MDVNSLHTAYTPDDIMARWTAAASGGHAGGGDCLYDGGSDDGELYNREEGGSGGSGCDDTDRTRPAAPPTPPFPPNPQEQPWQRRPCPVLQ